MALLETLLAFALTMLVCATIATIIVETILRLLKRREKDYDTMLRNLFEDVVWPQFEAQLKGKYADAASAAKTFALAMQKNPGVEPPGRTRNGGAADGATQGGDAAKTPADPGNVGSVLYAERHAVVYKAQEKKVQFWRRLLNWLTPRELTSITPMQFAERLAGTEVGKEIYKQGQALADTIVKDLAQKLDNIGKAAGEYYARRARTICMGIAVLLALAANIDGYKIFTTFLNQEQVRRAVIDQREAIEKRHLQAQVDLAAAERELAEQLKKDGLKSDEAPKPETESATKKKIADELRAKANDVKAQLADFAGTGTPIGWNYFPHCEAAQRDPRCASTSWTYRLNLLGWVLSAVFTGFLIGLGGPFWYDLVQSLSRVLQLARGLGLGKPKEDATPTARAPGAETEQPKNPVEAFRTAAVAAYSGTPGSGRGRVVLDAAGNEQR